MDTSPGETRAALILGARGLALFAAAAVLWHLPVDSLWLRMPALAIAAFLLLFALASTFVAVHGARNLLGRTLGVRNRSASVHVLSALFLLIAVAVWLGAYVVIGSAVGG